MNFKDPGSWKRKIRHTWSTFLENSASFLTGISFLSGWTLLTFAVVSATGFSWIWYASYGLLLILLCGLRLIGSVFLVGLYVLSQEQ